jgi:flagellar hook assembly protein FlgD
MIFNNLPSECEIQIYTINGEKVWGQTHSDALNTGPQNGQERWDGKNHLGQTVASGVYLWHVRSAEDEKTGKLMIIR